MGEHRDTPARPVDILALIDRSIRFQHINGGAAEHDLPADTGWRRLAHAYIARIAGADATVSTRSGTSIHVPDGCGIALAEYRQYRLVAEGRGRLHIRWSAVRCRALDAVDVFSLVDMDEAIAEDTVVDVLRLCAAPSRHASGDRRPDDGESGGEKWREALALLIARRPLRSESFRRLELLERVLPAVEFARASLSERVTRGMLAEKCRMPEAEFHRAFREAMHVAPMEYFQLLRLDRARRDLVQTDQDVSAIGRAVGFREKLQFNRAFKSTYGLSPAQYRRRFRRDRENPSG